MSKAAQQWTAQMSDGTVYTGGTGASTDVNVSVVVPANVVVFTVSSDTFADTVYIDRTDSLEEWFENGATSSPTFPLVYTLNDGTTLTIQRNSNAVGDLLYTQQ